MNLLKKERTCIVANLGSRNEGLSVTGRFTEHLVRETVAARCIFCADVWGFKTKFVVGFSVSLCATSAAAYELYRNMMGHWKRASYRFRCRRVKISVCFGRYSVVLHQYLLFLFRLKLQQQLAHDHKVCIELVARADGKDSPSAHRCYADPARSGFHQVFLIIWRGIFVTLCLGYWQCP